MNPQFIRLLFASVIVCPMMSGCAPQLGEVAPRVRNYRSVVKFPQMTDKPKTGSTWTPNRNGNFLFADQRAMRAGDIVTVIVEESANAKSGASTTLDRNSKMSNAVSGFLGLLKALKPDLIGADLLGGKSDSDFKGIGETSRTEKLNAKVPATVKKVLPNGNLYIEGYRTILVNNEEQHFYISGVIRPVDISEDNSVSSSRLAEAEIAFGGRGDISDKQRPGVIQRYVDKYNPF